MRFATSIWLSGTVLAMLACQAACVGRQASAAPNNPLRSYATPSPADAGGSAVRFVSGEDDAFGADSPPVAQAAFQEDRPDRLASSHDSALGVVDASPHEGGVEAAAFESESSLVSPTVHYDDQVAPAAHYRSAPRQVQPRRSSTPPPIYHGLREESHVPPSPTPAVDMQPIAEPNDSQDRFRGSGGLRSAQPQAQKTANTSRTANSPRTTNLQRSVATQRPATMQRPANAQRSSTARATGGGQPQYQSAAPVVRAAPERAVKMALAGISASSRPASTGGQVGLPAEQLLRKAHEWAAVAHSQDDYTRVIDACQKATRLRPDAVAAEYGQNLAAWAFNRRGQLRSRAGEQQLAMADFNAAIRFDPQCWRAIHNRGVLLAIERRFEPAFDDFNRTVTINPNYAKAYANRAALFVVAGQLKPAWQDYGRAIQLDPKLVTAQRGQARVCHLLGKTDEAIAHYDAAVRLAPKDAYTVARRAELLVELGRYTEAAADYDQAIELDPQLVSAFRGSAWLLATCPDESVSDPQRAVERAEVALQLEESPSADSFDALAAAQASGGDFQAAQQTVRHAIKLTPEQERGDYLRRLAMYQQSQPYRLGQNDAVQQASYAR